MYSPSQDHNDQQSTQRHPQAVEEWMLICQNSADLQPSLESRDIDWTAALQAYPNVEEMPTFISRHRESAMQQSFTTLADPQQLQGKQFQAYNLVQQHAEANHPTPLRLIVSGTAGTGKSYLIHCLRLLLGHRVRVAAPTGVAAFNIEGRTLHSLLSLPVKGEFKELQGERLHEIQQSLAYMEYLIIDEMSMVGRTLLDKLTSICIKYYLIKLIPYLEDAHASFWGFWAVATCYGSPPLYHYVTLSFIRSRQCCISTI